MKELILPVDVAFVTVNYNRLDLVRELSNFFRTSDLPFPFSFTVVDNRSKEDAAEYRLSYPEVKWVQNTENMGYGRAINAGVATTSSKYICVMNSDIRLNRESLVKLWNFLENHPNFGVCAPRLTYADGRDQGMIFNDSLLSFYAEWFAKILAKRAKRRLAKATAPLLVDGVLGAFFIIRRSIIPEPTLFDEDFFFYYEDSALAHLLKKRAIKTAVVPSAKVVHLGGASSSINSVQAYYDSRYIFLGKIYGRGHQRFIYFLDRARILRKMLFYSALRIASPSNRINAKKERYTVAWNASRRTL